MKHRHRQKRIKRKEDALSCLKKKLDQRCNATGMVSCADTDTSGNSKIKGKQKRSTVEHRKPRPVRETAPGSHQDFIGRGRRYYRLGPGPIPRPAPVIRPPPALRLCRTIISAAWAAA